MRLCLLFGFSAALLVCSATGQILDGGSSGPGDGEPSQCLSDATIQISANPATVTFGQASIVGWAVSLPERCQTVTVHFDGLAVSANGNRSVKPPATSAFTVTVRETRQGVTAQKSRSTTVGVSYPPLVIIDPSVQRPADVLVNALGSGNPKQTVELCDVEIDLTGRTNIIIGDNTALIASPGCARGPRSLGPKIFVRDARDSLALFRVIGDHVRIAGFRLEGPTKDNARGDRKEKGILIHPDENAEPILDIEISNMEIFHWAGVGVQTSDNVARAERGRLFNTKPEAVRIKGSFFHHNRHVGEGYGVASNAGAYATFKQNVFDENRHAIASGVSKNSDALDYSGYTARDNLILEDGGRACWDKRRTGGLLGGLVGGLFGGIGGALSLGGLGYVIGGWGWQMHQIDVHGDQNPWYSDNNWQCGVAGETVMIERNTILYTKGPTINIRGNPADKAVIDGNIFKDDRSSIDQNGWCGGGITKPIDVRPNNIFKATPLSALGKCDFVGDGQEDEFMATGATWWARSPVTKQWRYLNTMAERLPQLQLEDVDNEANAMWCCGLRGHADFILRFYSKSGTSRWTRLCLLPPCTRDNGADDDQ